MPDPFWIEERRVVLRGALLKLAAGRAHGDVVALTKTEGQLITEAASAWEEMMQMLDARALAGDLKGIDRG